MTFSSLAQDSVGTTKYSSRLGNKVNLFILHHTAGGTFEGNTQELARNANRAASVNYLLGTDGRYRGIVPEEYRAWTSGNGAYDRRAITQETVNTTGNPTWQVSDIQLERTAQLIADVAKRYGWSHIGRDNVIGHRQVPGNSTACPGPYLYPRLDAIVARASQIFSGSASPVPTPTPAPVPAASGSSSMKGVKIAEDGIWGGDTTQKLQFAFGTIQDRVVSAQPNVNKRYLPGVFSFNFVSVAEAKRRGGSQVIRKLQAYIGAGVDGFWGHDSNIALQNYLGTVPDGILSNPSTAVKEMQRRLNAGTF